MAMSERLKLSLLLLVLEILFIVLFAAFVEYDGAASPALIPKTVESSGDNSTKQPDAAASEGDNSGNSLHHYYPMFQDVHVMIFVGFGFLMVFLRRYGFSSLGFNMLISVVAIQWATIIGGLVHNKGEKIYMDITSMLTADFACAAVLITFGAVLGKTSPLQLMVITLLEIVFFSVNEYIGVTVLKAVDVGGSMFVHAFGAYFGLTLSRVMHKPGMESSDKEGSVYHSDLFSMVGSVFLWMFWPSFNSALAVEDAQHRAVLNTYLALTACCLVSFAISSLVDKNGKFDMVHIQNATLAGGVAVGTSADMMVEPYGALIIGSVAGALSVIGYKYITPFLCSKLKIHDTCGVNNLHGMPAILAGVIGAIMVSMADQDTYGYTLYRQFPAMAPSSSSAEWDMLKGHVEKAPGDGRTAGEQAGYQIAALGITLVIAVSGGLIVGVIIRFCPFLQQPVGPHLYEDSANWHVPDDAESSDLVNDVLSELDRRGKSSNSHADHSFSPLLEEKAQNGDNTNA